MLPIHKGKHDMTNTLATNKWKEKTERWSDNVCFVDTRDEMAGEKGMWQIGAKFVEKIYK